MIRIIDRTLSLLAPFAPEDDILRRLASLLFSCGADFLEITPDAYGALEGVLPNAQYILRISKPDEAKYFSGHKEIKRFVCPNIGDAALRVYAEIRINDMRDFFSIVRHRGSDRLRICGLADIILQPVEPVLNNLRVSFVGTTLELSPENDCYAANSIAVEWAVKGGTNIVTSVSGISNLAAFEDVSKALYIIRGRRIKSGLNGLDEIEALIGGLIVGSECP